jgi:nitrogen fixation protein
MGTNVVTPLPICPRVSVPPVSKMLNGTTISLTIVLPEEVVKHLYMMYYDNKPTWAASDLELSPGIDLKLPQLTTVTPLSTTVDTSNCDDLLKSTEILKL